MTLTTYRRSDGVALRDAALDALEQERRHFVVLGRRILLLRLLSGETATADDVRAGIDLPDDVDPVCLGSIPGPLARAGIIERVGFEATSRPNAHARPISVWRLRDRAAALAWLAGHQDLRGPPDPMIETRQLALPGLDGVELAGDVP